jgi:hypothetical protein
MDNDLLRKKVTLARMLRLIKSCFKVEVVQIVEVVNFCKILEDLTH